jgi:cytidyltransferase-like protein
MNDKIILVTGGFDPLHSGHIEYIKSARQLGRVVVGVNSDAWLARKKGQAFMPLQERLNIINNLKDVMVAIDFDDSNGSAKDAIKKVRKLFSKDTIVFANGGDRTKENIPEMNIDDTNIEFLFGVGGENKINSSSWILKKWSQQKVYRNWGHYTTYFENNTHNVKLKRLVLNTNQSISMQKHFKRNELWFVENGQGVVYTQKDGVKQEVQQLGIDDTIKIGVGEWHQLKNTGTQPLIIVEIQYGDLCVENDIERL